MFTKYTPKYLLCAAIFAALLAATTYSQTKLLRFPDIHGDRVAFTYGGDIWTAPAAGGTANRLTAHPGVEVFAKFSPDGKWMAFESMQAGPKQIWLRDMESGKTQVVSGGNCNSSSPEWEEDSRTLIFASDCGRGLGLPVLYRASLPLSNLIYH